MGSGNDDRDDGMAGLFDKLENKLVLLAAAGLLSIPANQAFQQAVPEAVRPDKFTGTMAREMETDIKGWVNLRLRPHDEHLAQAAKGWEMIYEMHEDIALIKHKVNELIEQHKARKNDQVQAD